MVFARKNVFLYSQNFFFNIRDYTPLDSAFWDVLLPMIENTVALTRKASEIIEYIIRETEEPSGSIWCSKYSHWREFSRIHVAVWKYRVCVARQDAWRVEGWHHDRQQNFLSIPNWLNLEGKGYLPLWQEGNQLVGIVERLITALQIARGSPLGKLSTVWGIFS